MSLFYVVHDVTISFFEFNSDLISKNSKITEWTFQWKMSFNPDPTKSAQKIIFNRKFKTLPHS